MAGLILFRSGRIMVNFVTIAVLGPQGLALAAVVVLDDAIGRIQNVGGGTVVRSRRMVLAPAKTFSKFRIFSMVAPRNL